MSTLLQNDDNRLFVGMKIELQILNHSQNEPLNVPNMEKSSVQEQSIQDFEALNSLSLHEFLKNYYKDQQECFPHFEILK
ncbi:hypothetical protein RclHR1_05360006 [Rhizophagus clarus]|uniref:Uncharacterized protein n=1 Tax=Rhizophagus clarus TaxID=94130 RepID=A0A2Z6RLY3_9GLOM|nr:hypothetical protein RclHR1_05360006 [Rhizophagus clarus]GES74960.1 hypothetical protein RCL_jg13031.t1 [Rhizophagus clarus]